MIKSKMRLWVVILSILMTVFAVIGLSACDIFGNNSNQQYAVIFDANGGKFADGSDTLAQYVYSGSYIAEPSSPSRTNYTFVGWSKNESDYEEWRFDQDKVKSSITLYAQWEQESGILLSMDGGTIEGKDVFLLVGRNTNEISLLERVECSDDSFWSLYRDSNGEQEIATKKITGLEDGDNIYYIIVQNNTKINIYTVTIHRSYRVKITYFDGEEVVRTDTAYTGEEYNVSYTPQINGYLFNHWENILGEQITSFTLWSEVNLYANKTACTYTATLDVNGGKALPENEQSYIVTYDKNYKFTVPTRTGYTFSGWYSGKTQITDSEGISITVWNFTNDRTITAQWMANQYDVELNVNNVEAGSVSGGGSRSYDSNVTISATTNNGFNFLGWYDENDQLVSEDAKYTFKMGFAVSYTAKWDYFTLTTSRNDENAGTLSTNYMDTKISAGQKITLAAKTNKGYTWVGWYDGETEISSDLSFSFTMERKDVVLEARWIKVTLVKDLENGGTITSLTGTYKAGDAVTVTAETTGGFIFLGWYDGTERLTEEMSYTFTMPKNNKTFTAKWIPNTAYIDSNGDVQYCDEEDLIILSTATDQTLTGWCILVGTVSGSFTLTISDEAHIILGDNCSWTVNGGIRVSEGNTLNIYAQSMDEKAGKLTTKGNIGGIDGTAGPDRSSVSGGAGSNGGNSGTIVINGGTISATNIGGGAGGAGGKGYTYVSGTGYNGSGGAGGAGGNGGTNGTIVINGGTISATNIGGGPGGKGGEGDLGFRLGDNSAGGSRGNGGAGGKGGFGGTITINGGSITATNLGGGTGGTGGDGGGGLSNFRGGSNVGGVGGTGGDGGVGGSIMINGGTIEIENIGGGIGGTGGSGGTGGYSYGIGGKGGSGGNGGTGGTIAIIAGQISSTNIGGGIGGTGGEGGFSATGGYTNRGTGGAGGNGGRGGSGANIILKGDIVTTNSIGGGIAGAGGFGGYSSGNKYASSGSKGSTGTKGIIYYESTQADWSNEKNIKSTNAEIYFYSKEQPNESGNYWHYDTETNAPTIWEAN